MALFNFSRPSNDNNSSNNNEIIQLIINDEVIDVPASEAAGLTIAEVFGRYAAGSCDVRRINRYVAQGRIVGGNTPAVSGTVYSGAITSESKG
jgi:hypothetical protein